MEVSGSNVGKFRHFHALFLPCGDCSIRVFQPHNYSCLVLPCYSIAVNVISFKPQKV